LIINGFLDAQGKPGELTAPDYRTALLTMVGVLVVGFVANLLIRPVNDRFHEPEPAESQPHETGDAVTVEDTEHGVSPLLVVAWIVVSIPLAYGVYETLVKAVDLVG
jgi:hypothetical protein